MPAFSKVFERDIYNRLYSFTNNERFNEKQFRTRCSTVLAFAKIVEKIQFNMSSEPFCIFLDFSKAFNFVNLDFIVEKRDIMA